MNKTQAIHQYLKENKSITSWEAIQKFRATRLSDIIYRLKRQGVNILTVEETNTNQEGETTRFARYIYRGESL